MKRIKAIGHLLFSFRGRISREKWWVAVGLLVVLNVWQSVWQANEILEVKKQVRLHNVLMEHEPIKMASEPIAYITSEGEKRWITKYHQDNCWYLMGKSKKSIELSKAIQKYDWCPSCEPPKTRLDVIREQTIRELNREEAAFAERVRRALRDW